MKRASVFALPLAFLLCSGTAFGADIRGTWLRDNGEMQVKIDKCGDSLCGTIIWVNPDSGVKAKVGQTVLSDMKPDGANSWAGTAKTPVHGNTYSGKMSLIGDSLTTEACLVGGLICNSTQWSRVR